jgi:hypothetical protein
MWGSGPELLCNRHKNACPRHQALYMTLLNSKKTLQPSCIMQCTLLAPTSLRPATTTSTAHHNANDMTDPYSDSLPISTSSNSSSSTSATNDGSSCFKISDNYPCLSGFRVYTTPATPAGPWQLLHPGLKLSGMCKLRCWLKQKL